MDGRSEGEAAPGSAAKIITRMVEGPVFGDLNGNGHKEAALLLSQETGGSGTFFYVAAAIAKDGRLRCTNAVSIVDQVDPQTICVGDGVIVARYKDRPLSIHGGAAVNREEIEFEIVGGHLEVLQP